ncbi:Predicted lipid carrier protein YhbT, contains SCP2 domain [Alteromonadaceae bacterium Bs31]|nr:Predicted lipid carrier protein YhbT, contains SCP2 domain [Alteromonadaceae bacterium Bs31]
MTLLTRSLSKTHNLIGKPVLARIHKLIPFRLKKKIIEEVLNRAFKQVIDDGDLEFLKGKVIVLNLSDLNESIFIGWNSSLQVLPRGEYDVEIRGDLDEFVTLALRKEDPDTLFFQRRICIQGDTELGLAVKNLIDSVDLEELPGAIRKGLSITETLYPYLMPSGAR